MIKVKLTRIYRVNNTKVPSVKAFIDVILNDLIKVRNVRIVFSREHGLFTSLPKQKSKDGKWYPTVNLVDDKTKQQFNDAVLKAYNV